MKLEFVFKIVAVILIGGAAIFLYLQNWDGVFACVVLALCSFFLSMRFQLKASVDRRKAEQAAPDETEDAE